MKTIYGAIYHRAEVKSLAIRVGFGYYTSDRSHHTQAEPQASHNRDSRKTLRSGTDAKCPVWTGWGRKRPLACVAHTTWLLVIGDYAQHKPEVMIAIAV